MPTTMKLIAKVSLGAGAANIEFTSIPGTYTDLQLVMSIRSARSAGDDDIVMTFNNSTSGRSYRSLYGTGSSTGSGSGSILYLGPATGDTGTANSFASFDIYIPNYAGSTNKSYSSTTAEERNQTAAYIFAIAGLWSVTDAITSIKVASNNSANLKSGSSAYLYGITKS